MVRSMRISVLTDTADDPGLVVPVGTFQPPALVEVFALVGGELSVHAGEADGGDGPAFALLDAFQTCFQLLDEAIAARRIGTAFGQHLLQQGRVQVFGHARHIVVTPVALQGIEMLLCAFQEAVGIEPAGCGVRCMAGALRRENSLNNTKASRPKIRMSNSCRPWKPSPNSMDASRPPAAIPASGPSQRLAPEAAAGLACWLRGVACCCGACWRCAGWLLCMGAAPKLLPPPRRRASASGTVRPTMRNTAKKGSSQRMGSSPGKIGPAIVPKAGAARQQ